jgi:hypothetical protein
LFLVDDFDLSVQASLACAPANPILPFGLREAMPIWRTFLPVRVLTHNWTLVVLHFTRQCRDPMTARNVWLVLATKNAAQRENLSNRSNGVSV